MATAEPTADRPHLQPRVPGAAAAYLAWVLSDSLRESPSGCWEWQGADNGRGYGVIHLKNWEWPQRAPAVHRIAYRLCVGPIPDGLCVLHRCDNPPCVRPDHLFLGTNEDNVADMVAKGRQARGEAVRANHDHLRGEAVVTARLTAETVMEVRRAELGGEPQADIAARLGISTTQVSSIVRGESWSHLPVLHVDVGKGRRLCPRCGAVVECRLGRYRRHLESCGQ